ncbi:protein kinase domain-containing protein [Persicimonas caeni]|nr:protein kinase [Persicimonas caeni]
MSSETPSLPQPGDLIGGRFRILEHLGTGGFGTVYKALQENVGREVALKFLTPGVAEDPINVERFRREAYHVSQLRHPHTITLYDYGQTEAGLVYMVMEILDGEALSDIIQNHGALEPPRAAHVFIQVLKSLSEAHRRGLVHRDLKPENIFLCEMFGEHDYVKVLDFGVAKMTLMDADDDDGEETLTKAGRIFGTPMYMAPEQACAEPITPATDVYALGLLLYEIWTGKPPVTGRNRMDVIHKQIRDPVPELSDDFEKTPVGQVIRTACMKGVDRRYQNAAELLEAFVSALRQMKIFPAPKGGTSPEISVTSLVPEDAPGDDSTHQMTPPSELTTHPARSVNEKARPAKPKATPPPVPPSQAKPANNSTQASPKKSARPPARGRLRRRSSQAGSRTNSQVGGRGMRRQRSRSQPGSPRYQLPLLGREDVLAQLTGIVEDSAAAKSGQIVLVEGESGIGKSRVVRTLEKQLTQQGVAVSIGHFRRRSLPMEALREALAVSWGVAHSERKEVDRVIRNDLNSIGGFSDEEIAFVVDFVRPPALDASQMPTSTEEAGALFARLERLLLKISEQKPFVLMLEDIQYADSATLSFLEYLAVTLRTQAAPIVVMMTLRPEERGFNGDVEQSLRTMNANIGVGFSRVPIKRLRGRHLARLLDAILPLQARIKERIGWLSQGVPLHAIQIIRYLRNEGKLVRQGQRWGLKEGSPRDINLPPDLMDLMHLRLQQAISAHGGSSDLRALLEWMAVLGMRTPVDLLVGVLAATGDVDVEHLDDALGALADEGIIHQTLHRNLMCVEFDSSLLREALLGDLSDRWSNRRLHQQAARHKADFYRDKNLELPLVEIADHWRQAGEMERYQDTLYEAARRSKERFDTRGARERFRELLGVLEEQGDRSDKWVHTHLALAELARRFGEFGLAEDHYRRIIAAGVKERPEGAEALRGFAHLLFVQRRMQEALDFYKRALQASQKKKDVAGVAKALVGLSRVYLMRGDAKEGAKVRDRLEEMLPHLPQGEIAGRVLLHLAEVSQRQGDLSGRYDYLVRARKELEDSQDRQGLSDVLIALGSSLMDPAMNAPDRLQKAGDVLREALEIKRSIGDRHGVAETFRYLGQLEMEHADFLAAESLLQQSLNVHEALGAPFNIGASHNGLGVAYLLNGEFDAAEHHWDQAIELFKRVGDQIAISHTMLNKGILAINRGDVTRAQSLLRESRRIKESFGSSWALFDLRNHLAIAAMWLGEFENAEQILNETLQDVDERGTDEDRTVARSLIGLLRCFQSRLQLAALELGRARADAEDLGIKRVTTFCQANAAFYSRLTEASQNFENLIDEIGDAKLFHTLHRDIWLSLIENMAHHALEQERGRQAVRLLRTVAAFHSRLGDPNRADALERRAQELDAELEALRT